MGHKLDWLPAFAFLIFGSVFFYASFQIQSFGGGNGGRLIPTAASGLIVFLSGVILIRYILGRNDNATTPIVVKEFFLRSGPLIALMAVYALFHFWFGYMAATFVCGFAGFMLFGNSIKVSLLHAFLGTLILYGVFVKLLGVYDPPGRLIDFSGYFQAA